MKHLDRLIIYIIYTTISGEILIHKVLDIAKHPCNIHWKILFPYIIIFVMLLIITYKKYKTFSDKTD
jgi:hypothetical protein